MMLVKLEAEYKKINSLGQTWPEMWNGYSDHQLVFGQNPNLQNIMNDNMPALEGTTNNDVFAKHVNTLHAARRIFIQTEADEGIRGALRR